MKAIWINSDSGTNTRSLVYGEVTQEALCTLCEGGGFFPNMLG